MQKIRAGAEHKCTTSQKKSPLQVIRFKDPWPMKSLSCKMCEIILGDTEGISCWPQSETGPGQMGCRSD